MKKTVVLSYSQKKYFFTVMLLIILVVTGCGRKVDNDNTDTMLLIEQEEAIEENDKEDDKENEKEVAAFQFEIEDAFGLTDGGGVVVTGYVQSGTMRAGVLLEGLEKSQVDAGDFLIKNEE